MQFHIFILFRFLCNKRYSKIIFRVRDEKPTHKHVLRLQMTEIGNLTSWPQMTLTSEKFTSGWERCLDITQTRIISIHRLLMRLLSVFCGGKALNGNAKHFVFDLTCDVIGDQEVVKICFQSRSFPGISNGFLISKIGPVVLELTGAMNSPPPPRPSGARYRNTPVGRELSAWIDMKIKNYAFFKVMSNCE